MDGIGSVESHVFQKIEDTDQSDPDQVQCSQGIHSMQINMLSINQNF